MPVSDAVVEQVVSRCKRGAELNRSSPGRVGNVVHLSPDQGDEILIAADMHGNRLNFNRLLKIADLDAHPRRHLVMQEVCHGGPEYPQEGGCMSHLLLEDMAELKTRYPDRFHFLLSNHELAELGDFPICKSRRMLNVVFRSGMSEMYGCSIEVVRHSYLEFLGSCPLAIQLSNGTFISHSLPEKCDTLGFNYGLLSRALTCEDWKSGSDVFRLVWGRDCRPENARAFATNVGAKLLIQGHEPCPEGFLVPNELQIILDCCGPKGSYLMLPIGAKITQREAVSRIERIFPLARQPMAANVTVGVR